MASGHSFTITLTNNVTEKEGINYLLENHAGFFKIDLAKKKEILSLLNVSPKFLQAFDLVFIPKLNEKKITSEIIETNIDEIILVELKTTKKHLPENPKGFFFGATENEFNFGKLLGDKFRFCFVCLNEKSKSHAMLTIQELESKIKTRRIQFQVNL